MANLTKNEIYIVDMYVRYFGKAPSVAEIAKYNDFKTPKKILTEIRGDADETKSLNTEEFVNNAFQNLFGRNATTKEMNKYSKVVDKGKDLPINAIVKAAKKADKGVYEAKKAIAIMLAEKDNATIYNNLDKITKDTYAKVYDLKTKKLLVDSVAALETKIDAMPDNVTGQTFMLTTSTDNFVGTEKGDVFLGSVSSTLALDTLNAIDRIDGGAGIDTLKVSDDKGAVVVPNMSNIEIIEVSGFNTTNLVVNTTATTGVTDLNIVKAAGDINADAGSTTNVTVNMKAAGKKVDVDGGKDVNVTLTDVAANLDVVTIGTDTDGAGADVGVAAAGNVVVDMTGKAATATATLSAVTVTGGKTISVTQKATSDSSKATTDIAGFTITQGAVNVTGNKDTTTVTVKQDAAVAPKAAVVGVAGKVATQSVEFTGAKKGDTIKLDFGAGDLTFTAKADLTAAQVASAFANLAADAKQGSTSATLGLYTNTVAGSGVTDGWTSGAVETVSSTVSKVVFSNTKDVTAPAITAAVTPVATSTLTATPSIVTDGTVAKTAVTGVMGVANGAVTINDSAAATIKTITVDGYANGSAIGGATPTTVLETLNLSNASGTASMTVADTAATLALTVEKLGSIATVDPTNGNTVAAVAAVVTLTAAPTTLNVTSTGNNVIDLDAALTEALTVNGTGLLDISTQDLDALKTVVVSGTAGLKLNGAENDTLLSVNTTATTGAVTASILGTKATYTGGAGVDTVTVTNAGTAISKAIDLGAGDDKLILSGTVATPTVEVKGGTGTDTLSMSAASAVALSGTTAFAAKVTGFERLEVAMAGTSDVTKDTVTIDLEKLGFNYVISNGVIAGSIPGTDDDILVFDKMANNGTIVLASAGTAAAADLKQTVNIKDATTGTADVLNVIIDSAAANGVGLNFGTLTADKVETINITSNDKDVRKAVTTTETITTTVENVTTNILTLTADKAATINVNGDGNLTLTLSPTDTAVTLIDASKATGKLEVSTLAGDLAATTVKGGSAADTITLTGAGDVAIGGAGNDKLIVSGSAATAVTLTGGDGVDTFDVSLFNSLGNAGSAVTITDLTAGETIKFANATDFVSSKVTLISEATFTEYAAEAAKVANGNIAWFQFNNNTFVVQDVNASSTFNAGDIIVKINGVKDLSTASFNATDDTLVIA